ncbi:MAG: hypothetical protein GEV10_02445 [Streptosporangiales bacterium]|nr:hypothetical protein [Streptosporangiales bacterium]
MSGLTRWTPRLVLALGVVHLVYGVVFSWSVLVEMAAEGVVATVHGAERGYVLWFLAAGIAMLTLGAFGTWAARTAGRLPSALGWGLVAIGLFVSIPEPISGGWLVLALGVLALGAARRSRPPVDH